MRIAILADIHGNLQAFEAALAHVRQQAVDQLVIAGDLINGAADSYACWQLAQTLDCVLLRGNHERYIFDFGTTNAPPLWSSERFAPVQWTAALFSARERATLAALPLTARLADAPNIRFMHASPRQDNDSITAYTPGSALATMFETTSEPYIVRGHDHWSQVRLWHGRTIVTSGSVGMTLDEHPLAQYVILERSRDQWQIQHYAVPYDVDTAVARFYSSGYLEAGGPMARLILREVATASPHIVPFLRTYERWQKNESLGLAEAVERFLTYW